ncbi:MAG: tyrosine-type recombinase/integrase [Acidiferrobacterales bacterium]
MTPATHELMGELARYRRECGLVTFPRAGETTPLVLPLNGEPRALTRAALHHVVKAVFHQAADRLRSRGEEFATRADHVAQASAHWLRHTAGSAMADGQLDLRFVRDNLGHASLTTTSVYLHAEEDERHAQTERRHRLGW